MKSRISKMKKFTKSLFPWFLVIVQIVDSYPTSKPNNNGDELKLTSFLRKYGYLPPKSNTTTTTSEPLYSEETLNQSIRLMQKFAGLKQTGIVDDDTLNILKKSRCGVPDIDNKSTKSDRLRSPQTFTWNKRRLSYSLQTWTRKLPLDEIQGDLKEGMDLWGKYGRLKFIQQGNPTSPADISISFSRYSHGDPFPFDGVGGTLAHAYYPTNTNTPGSLAGDIHFDEDEEWGKVTSFREVALHELGHSLGLAHSSSRDSVMFPYYEGGRNKGELKLGREDIEKMHQMYGSKYLPENSGEDSNSSEYIGDEPHPSTTSSTTRATPTFKPKIPTKSPTTETETSSSKMCNTLKNYDTISFIRQEIWVFKGPQMWRFYKGSNKKNLSLVGDPSIYPIPLERMFPFLKGVHTVDSVYERGIDGSMMFTEGRKYWIYDGHQAQGPYPLEKLGLPGNLDKIDASFTWGKNGGSYLFSGRRYWKLDEKMGKVISEGYPQNVGDRWGGVPEGELRGVFTFEDGVTYFFGNNEDFWTLDDSKVRVNPELGGRRVMPYWFNC